MAPDTRMGRKTAPHATNTRRAVVVLPMAAGDMPNPEKFTSQGECVSVATPIPTGS